MSRTLFGLLAKSYLAFFAMVMLVVLVVYLVADLGDRIRMYAEADLSDVVLLFGNKMLVMVGQLAPAAMLLAAGATVSALRQRGELTAMRALGMSPLSVVAPIVAVALALGVALVGYEDQVASRAGVRVDTMQVERFKVWGDFRFHYFPRQWLRVGPHVFQVRGATSDTELDGVTIYTLADDFSLSARLDAKVMRHLQGDQWELLEVRERDFGEESVQRIESRRVQRFAGTAADTFRIRPGRPEQMQLAQISEQARLRAGVGLPTRRFELAWHQRFTNALIGVVAAALAAALAMRPNRKGHLTVALLEGLLVAAGLWGLSVVGKALALSEHLTPIVAAWGPCVALALVAAAMLARLQRRA